jgi:hypothetical protein
MKEAEYRIQKSESRMKEAEHFLFKIWVQNKRGSPSFFWILTSEF